MSQADAVAFLERVESDESFAKQLESAKDNPDAVVEKVRSAGFDASPDEIREAFTDRYGIELTQEQLDQIAAGSDVDPAALGGAIGGSLVFGAAALAAAAV
jgi:predicted ribosomally synthesized peptide with nif11-like leader